MDVHQFDVRIFVYDCRCHWSIYSDVYNLLNKIKVVFKWRRFLSRTQRIRSNQKFNVVYSNTGRFMHNIYSRCKCCNQLHFGAHFHETKPKPSEFSSQRYQFSFLVALLVTINLYAKWQICGRIHVEFEWESLRISIAEVLFCNYFTFNQILNIYVSFLIR